MSDTIGVLERDKTERRARILAEAERVFFEEGYEGACIDDIIKRVGGSKRTIYNEFGNKEGLFAAMIAATVTRHSDDIISQLRMDDAQGKPVREVLVDYAKRVMTLVNSEQVVSLYRTVIAEAVRFPKLAQAFYSSGPGRSIGRFVELLEHYRERGEIDLKDCRQAAEQFGGLVRDGVYYAVLLGVRPPLSEVEIEERANATVDLFLKGALPRGR